MTTDQIIETYRDAYRRVNNREIYVTRRWPTAWVHLSPFEDGRNASIYRLRDLARMAVNLMRSAQ